MSEGWTYRPLQSGEEAAVCDFVLRVFAEFVAGQYVAAGVREFQAYVQPEALRRRLQADHFVLLAEAAGEIVGAIEVRACDHISLLFVAGRFQRRGIARELLQRALATCRRQRPEVREISVNSSPNAVQAYARLGFRPLGAEQTVNGIRFTPMALALAEAAEGRNHG